MNEAKAIAITSSLQALKDLNLNSKILQKYPNLSENDLKNQKINDLTLLDFKSLFDKTVNQFLKEIKSENGFLLPNYFNVNNTNYDIQELINSLESFVEQLDFHAAENCLILIVQYTMMFGFYDKSEYKIHATNSESIQNELSKLSLMNDNYLQLSPKYQDLLNDIEELKLSVNNFYSESQQYSSEISNNLEQSHNYINQIQEINQRAITSENEVKNILEQSKKIKKDIDDIYDNIIKQSKIFNNNLIEQEKDWKNKVEQIYKDFNDKLEFVGSKTQYFEDRNQYLDELIGREVGASLFETFKQRKIELNKSVKFWAWCVPIVSILSLVYTLTIFTNGFGTWGEVQTQFSWQIFTLNVLKSIPVIFILYYCISQYNKERNFQEEYAFKSASALTIKAYADILNEANKKDELIFEAVNNLYKSPHHLVANNKDVNSTLDLAKEIVSKLGEVVSPKKDKIE